MVEPSVDDYRPVESGIGFRNVFVYDEIIFRAATGTTILVVNFPGNSPPQAAIGKAPLNPSVHYTLGILPQNKKEDRRIAILMSRTWGDPTTASWFTASPASGALPAKVALHVNSHGAGGGNRHRGGNIHSCGGRVPSGTAGLTNVRLIVTAPLPTLTMVPNSLTFTNAVTINSTTNAAKVGDAMSLYVTGEASIPTHANPVDGT